MHPRGAVIKVRAAEPPLLFLSSKLVLQGKENQMFSFRQLRSTRKGQLLYSQHCTTTQVHQVLEGKEKGHNSLCYEAFDYICQLQK